MEQALMGGEIECRPCKAESTEADDIENCGNAGNAVSAQRCSDDTVESVDEGKRGNCGAAGCTVSHGSGSFGQEESDDLEAENIAQQTQYNAAHDGDEHTAAQNLLDSVVLLGAYVLTRKYGAALTEAFHCGENETINIDGGGITGNGKGAEAVYGSLQRDIGAGKAGGLKACGYADLEDTGNLGFLHSQLIELYPAGLVKSKKMSHNKSCGKILGDESCQRYAHNRQLENGNEYNIHHYVACA